MNNRLSIIGSGDLGRLIAYHAQENCGYEVIGYYDDFNSDNLNSDSKPILGKLDQIENDFQLGKFDYLMIGIGYKHMNFREFIFLKFLNKIPFAKIVHPSVIKEKNVIIGDGSFILPGCVLDQNVIIGKNSLLNTGCIIAHDTEIGNHSFLSPAVKVAGFSKISEKCIIGINATIIDNIIISDEIQVGGGAVVTKNLTEKGLYVGVPAKKIK